MSVKATIKMKSKDWDDAADLADQAAVMAENSTETHTKSACKLVTRKLLTLSMRYHDSARKAEKRENLDKLEVKG